jgi:hypothetical protein
VDGVRKMGGQSKGHALGPLELDDEFSVYVGDRRIARMESSGDEAEAYARLFVAAPKMLAELRRLSERYGWQTTADVIAEATGEAQ